MNFKKLNEAYTILKVATKYAAREIVDVFNHKITSSEDAYRLLSTTATVTDLYDIKDGLSRSIPADQYVKFDGKPVNVVFFKHDNSEVCDEKSLEKVYKAVKAMKAKRISDVYCIKNGQGKYQYFMLIHEGKNGNGDFVDDDMKNVVKYLDTLKANGATWRSVTDLSNDIIDDISAWVITFKFD